MKMVVGLASMYWAYSSIRKIDVSGMPCGVAYRLQVDVAKGLGVGR